MGFRPVSIATSTFLEQPLWLTLDGKMLFSLGILDNLRWFPGRFVIRGSPGSVEYNILWVRIDGTRHLRM